MIFGWRVPCREVMNYIGKINMLYAIRCKREQNIGRKGYCFVIMIIEGLVRATSLFYKERYNYFNYSAV